MAKNYKTIALTGAEQKVVLAGQNCDIRNDSVDIVYVSADAGITSGADGVLSIPAGQAAKLLDCRGTLYILGTGSVMLCGNDYSELVFKSAASASGGGGVDQGARDAINAHVGDADIHLTAEKAIEAAATAISNPNLLINPDFKINQRGKTEYTGHEIYTIDRWKLTKVSHGDNPSGTVIVEDDGIIITAVDANVYMSQIIEKVPIGETVTYSIKCNGTVYYGIITLPAEIPTDSLFSKLIHDNDGNRIGDINLNTSGTLTANITAVAGQTNHFEWAKLEFGSVATQFTPPDPATELAKCQRYYQRLGGSASSTGTFGTGFIGGTSYATVNIGLANPMRIRPTITITGEMCLATGGYNGQDGVIRTSTWVSGWHSTTSSATVVLDISHVADETIVGNACLLQIRDATSYIELSAEL